MRTTVYKISFFLVPVFLCFSFSFSWAEEAKTVSQPMPVEIEADRMESRQEEKGVFFAGNVEARQGELILQADEMMVYYVNDAPPSGNLPQQDDTLKQRIKKLNASGNIRIQNQGWTATGNSMEYYEIERKVILEGDAKVWQKNNLISGQKVIVYLDEGKSIIERGTENGERVKAFFYPEKNTE